MKKNIGTVDRFIRLAISLVLLGLAYLKMSFVFLGLGLFVLFEACFSWCILYQLLGKSSCPINKKTP